MNTFLIDEQDRMRELTLEKKTVSVIFTIYTTDGKEWESAAQELSEFEVANWHNCLASMKNLGHVTFPVIDAFGRKNDMYFNPDFVVAVRITEVERI